MTLIEIRRFKVKNWGRSGCPPYRLMRMQETRALTYRRVETTIQRKRSLLLQTARWSGARDFCRRFCRRHSSAQHISIRFPNDFGVFDSWLLFLSEWRRQCGLEPDEKLHIIAERKGFRWKIKELFELLPDIEERIFLFDQIERWPITIIEDVQRAWSESKKDKPVPLLILAGAIQGGVFPNRVWLYDYSIDEARTLLSSSLGRDLNEREEDFLLQSGGIPELVYALLWGMQNDSIEQAWMPIRREICSVVDLVGTRENLLDRLYQLQLQDLPTDVENDVSLAQAGLVRIFLRDGQQFSQLRSPLISELLVPLD